MRRILFCGVLISGTFITEKSGMRKDRYSSLMMNVKICQELGIKLKPKNTIETDMMKYLPIKRANRFSAFR